MHLESADVHALGNCSNNQTFGNHAIDKAGKR